MKRVVYLDHHATTPVDPRVLEAMTPCFLETFGNPASRTHRWGWDAEAAITDARESMASDLGATSEQVIFTSGATESINMALLGLAAAHPDCNHVVATTVEHRAVLDTLSVLSRRGLRVDLLPVDGLGRVSVSQVEAALTPKTLCVCVIHANNEIGTIQSIAAIAEACHDRGVTLFSDASQSVGHIPVDVGRLGIDLLALSAHKFYGPKGIGALVVRPGLDLSPILFGGGHERGYRPGTLNVPGIVGMATALRIATHSMAEEASRIAGLRDRLQADLCEIIPAVRVNGHSEDRLPGNLNMSFDDVEAEAVLIALTDIALSTGSACASAKIEPSHVLRAIGLTDELVHGSIRFGLGRTTTFDDVDYTVRRIAAEVSRLRQLSPSWVARTRGVREERGVRAGLVELLEPALVGKH